MDKPMLVFKRFGHQLHLMVKKEAKRCGIEVMGGPQGQVLRFLDRREQDQELTLIKDISEAHGAKWFGGVGGESK